jgi:tRNA-dihydrouridine synthase A
MQAINPIQIAPMVGVTTPHFNYFMRLICPRVGLYTEMTTVQSIRYGRALQRFAEIPDGLILQLAGNQPAELAYCAEKAAHLGFSGININIGCPSSKIKKADYGAVLFKKPALVAACVRAMKQACDLPISVKTRIGVDDHDNYLYLARFIEAVAAAGCDELVLHARKALLKGLSPKANRTIPKLRYDVAQQVAIDFPHIPLCINGGIADMERIMAFSAQFSSVMLGRVIDKNPMILQDIDAAIYGVDRSYESRASLLARYSRYVKAHQARCNPILLMKPLMGLFYATPLAKHWHEAILRAFNKKHGIDLLSLAELAESL